MTKTTLLLIEVKREKGGRVVRRAEKRLSALERVGREAPVAYGSEDAKYFVDKHI